MRGNNIVAMDIFDALTVDKLMKGKLKPEEEDKIPPNKLYEMKRIVADKQAYKNYLNYIIDHITLSLVKNKRRRAEIRLLFCKKTIKAIDNTKRMWYISYML